jgi:CheY-like chemotaxis protein
MSRILLVEDNEPRRDMLARRLARKGFAVVVAVDGSQAVALARGERPDLILMDIGLPGMDGWEATRAIRDDQATRAIPIIALTACVMESDRAQTLRVGCNDFETKPIDFPRLLAKMEALLGRGLCA